MVFSIQQLPFSIFDDNSINKIDFKTLSIPQIENTQEYQELLVELQKIFKTELHAHLGGAVSIEFIKKYSTPEDSARLETLIDQFKTGINYVEAFEAFFLTGKVLNSNQRMEEAAFDFCRCQYNDNVNFSELRTGLKKLDGEFEDYLKAVINGLKQGMSTYGITVTLVLSLRRDTSIEDANKVIDLAISYYQKGLVVGIDISGDSTKGNGDAIFEPLQRAKNHGLPITLHIGENSEEKPEQQIKELIRIQPDRIGHAVHLCSVAQAWVKNKKIVIEACLRSAVGVKMIEKPGEHPALELFKQGYPVVFCTDDSLLFKNSTEQLALVGCICQLTVEELVEIQKKSLQYAFKIKPNLGS